MSTCPIHDSIHDLIESDGRCTCSEKSVCPACKGRGGYDTDEDCVPCAWCSGTGRQTISGILEVGKNLAGENSELRIKLAVMQYRHEPAPPDMVAIEFMFKSEFDAKDQRAVRFVRMNSPFYEGEKWAVRWLSNCLGKDGEWEIEASPSNRDEKFYDRCRFASLSEAVVAFKGMKKEG